MTSAYATKETWRGQRERTLFDELAQCTDPDGGYGLSLSVLTTVSVLLREL